MGQFKPIQAKQQLMIGKRSKYDPNIYSDSYILAPYIFRSSIIHSMSPNLVHLNTPLDIVSNSVIFC